jgi:hypothetical protein
MLLAVYVTVRRFQPVQFSHALQLLPKAFVLPSLVTIGEGIVNLFAILPSPSPIWHHHHYEEGEVINHVGRHRGSKV